MLTIVKQKGKFINQDSQLSEVKVNQYSPPVHHKNWNVKRMVCQLDKHFFASYLNSNITRFVEMLH